MKRILIALVILSLSLALLAGCSQDNGDGSEISLESILEAVKERIAADLRDQGFTDEDFAEEPLPGFAIGEVDPEELGIDSIDSSFVISPGFGISPDEVIVIKAESGKANDVKEALEARNSEKEDLYRDYDPAGADRIAVAVLKVKGDYVICIIFDNAGALEAAIDQLFN